MSVNRRNTQKWVDALRSGKYKQGRNQLRNDDGTMCCLGVACDVSGVGNWNGTAFLGETLALPREVQQWLGVELREPKVFTSRSDYYNKPTAVTILNDSKGWGFNEIANALERTYLS